MAVANAVKLATRNKRCAYANGWVVYWPGWLRDCASSSLGVLQTESVMNWMPKRPDGLCAGLLRSIFVVKPVPFRNSSRTQCWLKVPGAP